MMSESIGSPASGDVVAERYQLGALIGQGGMGRVYEATNLVTGKRVAIKWMRSDRQSAAQIRRFLREARAASRVQHPNIVDVYDVGEHHGRFFLVMELLKGRSLADHLREHARLPLQHALAILLPAMRGVRAAHSMGVVHRDLKPANIFLPVDDAEQRLAPKVLDFGVSKIVARDDAFLEPTLSGPGCAPGTPHYMAPEQLDEQYEVDHRADVYAFGVLFYQLLGGRLPFDASNLTSLILRIHRGDYTPLGALCPELSPDVVSVVHRALAPDPAARFQDLGEMLRALTSSTALAPEVAVVARSGSRLPSVAWFTLASTLGLLLGWYLHEVEAGAAIAPIPAPQRPPGVAGAPLDDEVSVRSAMVVPPVAIAPPAGSKAEPPAISAPPATEGPVSARSEGRPRDAAGPKESNEGLAPSRRAARTHRQGAQHPAADPPDRSRKPAPPVLHLREF